jgi:hypothetical protein
MTHREQRGQVQHVDPGFSVVERAIGADRQQRSIHLGLELPELAFERAGRQPLDAVEVAAVRHVLGLRLEGLQLIQRDDEQLRFLGAVARETLQIALRDKVVRAGLSHHRPSLR